MPRLPLRDNAQWCVVTFTREGSIVYGPFGSFTEAVDFASDHQDWYGQAQVSRLMPPRSGSAIGDLIRLLFGRP